jgi:endonuclease-8
VPEGDTIHRTARSLHQALAGRTVTRFEAPRLAHAPFPVGTVVVGVEARGKHCLVHFGDGRSLHTHMRMTGSWHLYRPGERWRKKPAAARVVLEVAPEGDRTGWVAVCFAAPVVELVTSDEGGRPAGPTAHLGPDLVRPGADLDAAVDRLGATPPDREIGDALLDQRIANGVGNVYKCEVLFICGIDPFTPVGDVEEGQRRALLETAHRLLLANLEGTARITVEGGLAVYGRRGRPCRRCGTAVAWRPQGPQARGTYWCPTCQPGPAGPDPAPEGHG